MFLCLVHALNLSKKAQAPDKDILVAVSYTHLQNSRTAGPAQGAGAEKAGGGKQRNRGHCARYEHFPYGAPSAV